MIILDTDHVTVLRRTGHSHYAALAANMKRSADQDFVTTAVSIEEQMRGWLAAIRRTQKVPQPGALLHSVDWIN
jgi:hypothetical protein